MIQAALPVAAQLPLGAPTKESKGVVGGAEVLRESPVELDVADDSGGSAGSRAAASWRTYEQAGSGAGGGERERLA